MLSHDITLLLLEVQGLIICNNTGEYCLLKEIMNVNNEQNSGVTSQAH